ncbi:hypothetical protein E4T56_gene3530 [Termitomyces sp. T112]|nr:hypothetical protein E4T56_gene3530 [Termitomyces sp. T112]
MTHPQLVSELLTEIFAQLSKASSFKCWQCSNVSDAVKSCRKSGRIARAAETSWSVVVLNPRERSIKSKDFPDRSSRPHSYTTPTSIRLNLWSTNLRRDALCTPVHLRRATSLQSVPKSTRVVSFAMLDIRARRSEASKSSHSRYQCHIRAPNPSTTPVERDWNPL